ncbi:MAG: CapA family protein [Prevotella sp.]|nr:CapA family protein [Prevotella sp.]
MNYKISPRYAVALCAFIVTTISCNGNSNQSTPNKDTIPVPQEHRLSLLIAGDLMQHDPQIKAARRSDGTYNYDECFARVKPEIERADVAIGNFEVTLGGPPYKGYPQFSCPDSYLNAAIDAGFDIMLTANNHCLDSYQRGLERTIHVMDSLGVPHLGTYVNAQERQQKYPFLLEQNGIRVVLLNFTYGTNGLKVKEPNVVNYMDTLQIAEDIEKAKQMKPDVIVAIPHWGIEYQTLPSKEQRHIADWLIRQGVDHVIGGHPHVAQPLELLNNGRNLVAYSLGNFISNQSKPNTYGGYMVRMEFTKLDSITSSVTTLSDCGYTLYWVSRPADSGHRHQYRILPIDEPDSALTAAERTKRNIIRASMRRLFEKNNKGAIKEYPLR